MTFGTGGVGVVSANWVAFVAPLCASTDNAGGSTCSTDAFTDARIVGGMSTSLNSRIVVAYSLGIAIV